MAYSRFFNSDIYIYPSVLGDIVCSGCLLGTKSVNIENDADLLWHIQAHRDQGHNVPDDLESEILSDPDRYRDLESSKIDAELIEDHQSSLEFDQEEPLS